MMQINEKNYVDKAEAAITRLSKMVNRQGKVIPMVTTSKIRNLLAMAADIYNQALDCKEDVLPDELISRIDYLRTCIITISLFSYIYRNEKSSVGRK